MLSGKQNKQQLTQLNSVARSNSQLILDNLIFKEKKLHLFIQKC